MPKEGPKRRRHVLAFKSVSGAGGLISSRLFQGYIYVWPCRLILHNDKENKNNIVYSFLFNCLILMQIGIECDQIS